MVVYSFYEGDTRVLQYAKALANRGDQVEVVCLRRPGQPSHEVLNNVHVYRIQTRTVNERGKLSYLVRILRFLLAAALFLTRKHLQRRFDVIHVHSVPDFLVFAAVIPRLLSARVILDIHDILPEFYASKFGISSTSPVFKLLLLVERLSIAFSDHVIVANHLWQTKLISRSVLPAKCTTIVNYPDPETFVRRTSSRADDRFVILYPGTLNFHQGLDVAIRALARIKDQIPTAEFHIYGEGPEKNSLAALARRLLVEDRVKFHDIVPTHEISPIMAACDLAVVPKRASSPFGNEAASTKIIEFMALGIPLIVSRTKVDSYYFDSSMVKFFESENDTDLADSILLLWHNRQLCEQLVANALRYVERNNWSEKKRDYLELIDSLVSPAPLLKAVAPTEATPR